METVNTLWIQKKSNNLAQEIKGGILLKEVRNYNIKQKGQEI
jgi:hypothetical protein